jgi:hypothetical protein
MSYRTLTVNTVEPEGLGLTDVITVASPVDGQILQKKATDWGTVADSRACDSKIGYQVNSAPGNTTYRYDVEDNYMWRRASSEIFLHENIAEVAASGSYVPVATNAWVMGFTLDGTFFNGKTVLLYALPNPFRFSASSTVFQWGIGTGALSSWSSLGPKAEQTDVYGAPCWGLYTGSGTSETLTLKVISKSGITAITNGSVASVGQIVMKVVNE